MNRDVELESTGRMQLAVRVAAAWALVGLPLAWGVWQVVKKSLDLFR